MAGAYAWLKTEEVQVDTQNQQQCLDPDIEAMDLELNKSLRQSKENAGEATFESADGLVSPELTIRRQFAGTPNSLISYRK